MDRDSFEDYITHVLRLWAESHPEPDEPVLLIADSLMAEGSTTFTPRQIANEVEERTEFGEKQLHVLRHFAESERDIGYSGVIRMFESEALSEEAPTFPPLIDPPTAGPPPDEPNDEPPFHGPPRQPLGY